MRALLLGSGGRESALAWGLSRSTCIDDVVAAPGNPGIARVADLVDVALEEPAAVVELARRIGAGLVMVGPEAPLVAGVADALREAGIPVFGPDASAAKIEGSKAHAKSLMERAGISTAAWRSFTDAGAAVTYLDELGPPYVIKADGLAGGKGVVVTSERDAAIAAVNERLVENRFGVAGSSIVIEEFLDGEEVSLIALCDGIDVAACEPAQDYKRARDGDEGANTGGMGSYSPVPSCPPDLAARIVDEVIEPMVRQTAAEGAPFVGAIYAGLALTGKGVKVVEFNARFGDPETQALIPRLSSDLGEAALATATGQLRGTELRWSNEVCVTVVLCSRGYPGPYASGHEITGLEAAGRIPGVAVFHSGTRETNGKIETAGGRVLAVSATADSFGGARARAYQGAAAIDFEGKYARTDIGLRAERIEGSES